MGEISQGRENRIIVTERNWGNKNKIKLKRVEEGVKERQVTVKVTGKTIQKPTTV